MELLNNGNCENLLLRTYFIDSLIHNNVYARINYPRAT